MTNATRIAWLVAVAAVAGGALLAAPPASAESERDSSITVEWGTGNVTVGADATATAQEVKAVNPDHAAITSDGNGNDAGSGHWEDFQNLKVTVGQTTGLLDQGVQLSVEGMKPPKLKLNYGSTNFVQVMQCWGDPSAEDFRKTCQWGGYSSTEVGGATVTIGGLEASTSNVVNRGPRPSEGREDVVDGSVRFRSVAGDENKDQTSQDVGDGGSTTWSGLGDFFAGSSSNEIPILPADAKGTAEASFPVQSAATQPYLGCGAAAPRGAGERCWLVIVPRGEHGGGLEGAPVGACDGQNAALGYNEYGVSSYPDNSGELVQIVQKGSPISTTCSYWDNRIVVPLDFEDPFQTCPGGDAARAVIGTELTAAVMTAWQSSLCKATGATFALSTNSGDLARSQLLQGQTGLATVSLPLTPETIGSPDRSALAGTSMRYAPLANTSLSIGFAIAESRSSGLVTSRELKLTPRLVAKMLTQSFRSDVPSISGEAPPVSDSLETIQKDDLAKDEEWKALGNPAGFENRMDPAWVVVGPQGDDVNQLLWQYVLADADAVAFLKGEPDPWGNTVNPYYLPPGSSKAAGGGYDVLSRPLAGFPRADQSYWPDKETANKPLDQGGTRGLTIDSVGYMPYSKSFADNAKRISAGDSRTVASFDPSKSVGSTGVKGDWSIGAPKFPGTQRLLLGPTGASDASRYNLRSAKLGLPSAKKSTKASVAARSFVESTDATVAATIAARQVDPKTGMALVDMAALTPGQYPLATTIYAAADLNADVLTADARRDYAGFLEYAAGPGNQTTGARGTLPPGYVPLSAAQVGATKSMAAELRITPGSQPTAPARAPAPGSAPAPVPGGAVPPGAGGQEPPAAEAQLPADAGSAGGPAVSTTAAGPTEVTGAVAGSAGLGGALLGGVAGLAAAPFLLRRREVGG